MNMNNFTFVYSIRIHEYNRVRELPGAKVVLHVRK